MKLIRSLWRKFCRYEYYDGEIEIESEESGYRASKKIKRPNSIRFDKREEVWHFRYPKEKNEKKFIWKQVPLEYFDLIKKQIGAPVIKVTIASQHMAA